MGIGDLLRRGLAAGAAAGCLAAVWLLLITEGPIRRALNIEDARGALEDAAHAAMGHARHHEDELVTHPQQVLFAVLVLVVVGALLGLAFAVVYAASRGRLPGQADHTKALALGGIAFFAVTFFPFLAIPGNPPAVGNPDTVGERTGIYLGSIVLGVLLVLATFALDKLLAGRSLAPGVRVALDLAFFVVAGVLLLVALPNTPDAVQDPAFSLKLNASPELIWDFRLASLGQFVVLWGSLGAIFGALVSRKATAVETAEAREAVAA
jgi:hypothetical protein